MNSRNMNRSEILILGPSRIGKILERLKQYGIKVQAELEES
jgi:hypothetical protein